MTDERGVTRTATEVDTTEVSPPAKPARLERGTKLGRYEIGEVIGTGGMGVVYRARDPELNRDVAIKVVGSQGGRSQERLLAEARAMAKLDHPSLMPVFDVGALENGVFVVMPYLTGGTLHDWIHAEPRPWREVVARFIKAGRGLAAAHAAGLVHRDFKPRNVLLDGDDVLVADFGLVAGSLDATPGAPIHASTIGGTPGYMSPEQALGKSPDARADIFSFCVSLWEGLHGERPADAVTRTQRTLSLGTIPPVPESRNDSPTWVRRAAARGFADRPEDRWPSMAALLNALDRRARPRRSVIVAFVALAAATTAGAVFTLTRSEAPSCPDPRGRLAGAWDARTRAAVEAGFRRAAPSIADATLAHVIPALDRYAERWASVQLETCQAARVRRTLTPALADHRQVCLDRRHNALRALVANLADSPTPSVVVAAADGLRGLPDIEHCTQDDRLSARQARPTDSAQRSRLDELERELESIDGLGLKGEMKVGLTRSQGAVDSARATGYAPLLADALRVRARFEIENARDAEATLRELAQVAAEAQEDRLAAFAWIRLVNHLAHRNKLAEAKALEPVAEAAIARAGNPVDLRFDYLISSGGRALTAEELDVARVRYDEAATIARDDRDRAAVAQYRARATILKQGPVAAMPVAEDALRLNEKAWGPGHPRVADVLNLLAQANTMMGNYDIAALQAERQISILEAVYGKQHAQLATPLRVLAYIAKVRGHHTQARDLSRRGVEVAETTGEPQQLSIALASLAESVFEVDGFETARPIYERALATMEAYVGREHQQYVGLETEYAARLVEQKRCDLAEPYLTHGIEYFEATRPELTAMPLATKAQCTAAAGRDDEAIAELERVLTLCQRGPCEPITVLTTHATLGQWLIESRRDRHRGERLLNEALDGLESNGMTKFASEVRGHMKRLGVRPRRGK